MIDIGKFNHLEVIKEVEFGVFLDGGSAGNILLPKRYVPANTKLGDSLDVFIYLDSEDQLIATTERPLVQVNQCAYLRVNDVNHYGAFLDWGLPKDLMVPFKQQQQRMSVDRSYVVYVYLDDASQRLVASSKLNKHLPEKARCYQPGEQVDLLIYAKTELGYKAVINQSHLGLIFRDDAFKPLKPGVSTVGYVKGVRSDGKIDLSLQPRAAQQRTQLSADIMLYLQANGGVSHLTDKSPPDLIYKQFNCSKSNYKKALGALYKDKKIVIEEDEIRLTTAG